MELVYFSHGIQGSSKDVFLLRPEKTNPNIKKKLILILNIIIEICWSFVYVRGVLSIFMFEGIDF